MSQDILVKTIIFILYAIKWIYHNSSYYFVSIPVTPAGKLDKNKLPPIGSAGTEEEGLPSTETEGNLAQLWCEVLNISNIDVQEGFFDLGG